MKPGGKAYMKRPSLNKRSKACHLTNQGPIDSTLLRVGLATHNQLSARACNAKGQVQMGRLGVRAAPGAAGKKKGGAICACALKSRA